MPLIESRVVGTIRDWSDILGDKFSNPWPFIWNGAWKRRHLLGGNLFLIQILFFGLFGIAVPYFASNQFVAANGVTVWDPEIALDRTIPVIPWMIVPYMALYLYYPVTLLCTPKDDHSRMELIAGVQMLSIATIACTLIFLILPAEVDMRDQIPAEVLQGDGLYSALFVQIHSMDEPWNAWPSIHIAHSYFLTRSIGRWMKIRSPESIFARIFVSLVWVEFILLSISILTTKQHYVWDLFTGMAVGVIGWIVAVRALDRIRGTPEEKLHQWIN